MPATPLPPPAILPANLCLTLHPSLPQPRRPLPHIHPATLLATSAQPPAAQPADYPRQLLLPNPAAAPQHQSESDLFENAYRRTDSMLSLFRTGRCFLLTGDSESSNSSLAE